jgi:hypothetical protein
MEVFAYILFVWAAAIIGLKTSLHATDNKCYITQTWIIVLYNLSVMTLLAFNFIISVILLAEGSESFYRAIHEKGSPILFTLILSSVLLALSACHFTYIKRTLVLRFVSLFK